MSKKMKRNSGAVNVKNKAKAMVTMDDYTSEFISKQVTRKSIKKAVKKNMSLLRHVNFG